MPPLLSRRLSHRKRSRAHPPVRQLVVALLLVLVSFVAGQVGAPIFTDVNSSWSCALPVSIFSAVNDTATYSTSSQHSIQFIVNWSQFQDFNTYTLNVTPLNADVVITSLTDDIQCVPDSADVYTITPTSHHTCEFKMEWTEPWDGWLVVPYTGGETPVRSVNISVGFVSRYLPAVLPGGSSLSSSSSGGASCEAVLPSSDSCSCSSSTICNTSSPDGYAVLISILPAFVTGVVACIIEECCRCCRWVERRKERRVERLAHQSNNSAIAGSAIVAHQQQQHGPTGATASGHH